MEEFLFRTRVFSPHSAVTGALLALGLALIAPAAIAEDVVPVPPLAVKGTRVIEVNGAITQALVPKIRAALEAVESERFPAGRRRATASPKPNSSGARCRSRDCASKRKPRRASL